MKKHQINKGEKHGYLTIIKEVKSNNSNRMVLAECRCGKRIKTVYSPLFTGRTKSCGCYSHELAGMRKYVHGMSGTKFHYVYSAMIGRCRNSHNKDYKEWGGRGILCLWNDFMHFKTDMYKSYLVHIKKYGKLGTVLDRINNDGDYCKKNCRWVTYKQSAANRRKIRFLNKRDKITGRYVKTRSQIYQPRTNALS